LIRKVAPDGTVSTLAGSGQDLFTDGTGIAASFRVPECITIDAGGNLYVTDYLNIRKITSAGIVTTIAGTGGAGAANGTGTAASFFDVQGIAIDGSGNLFVADLGNNMIRKITSAGVVTTLAGSGTAQVVDGTGTAASFNGPQAVAMDKLGNIYVSDSGTIRSVSGSGVVKTVAGSAANGSTNGVGTAAKFSTPFGMAFDASGNLFVADTENNEIRKLTF
jgi:sugar lactone lactonase YvrE